MGKKRLRKKNTSKGIHSSVSAAIVSAVRATRSAMDVEYNKHKAWMEGKNPWITMEVGKEKSNTRYRRFRANDLWGPFKKKAE